jgi:hypothetical protein
MVFNAAFNNISVISRQLYFRRTLLDSYCPIFTFLCSRLKTIVCLLSIALWVLRWHTVSILCLLSIALWVLRWLTASGCLSVVYCIVSPSLTYGFYSLSFVYCIVSPSLTHGFWLFVCCLLHCESFIDLRLLITPLVSSQFSIWITFPLGGEES